MCAAKIVEQPFEHLAFTAYTLVVDHIGRTQRMQPR
jgi:hypothetical protein